MRDKSGEGLRVDLRHGLKFAVGLCLSTTRLSDRSSRMLEARGAQLSERLSTEFTVCMRMATIYCLVLVSISRYVANELITLCVAARLADEQLVSPSCYHRPERLKTLAGAWYPAPVGALHPSVQ